MKEEPLEGADINDPNNTTQKVGDPPRFTNGFEAVLRALLPTLSDRDLGLFFIAVLKESERREKK